jgi:hypothetical protein
MGRSYTTLFNTIRKTEFYAVTRRKEPKLGESILFNMGCGWEPEYLSVCMGHFVCYFTCPFGYRILVFNTSSTLAYSLLRLCQSDVPVYSWLHLKNWLVLSVQGLIKYGSAHCRRMKRGSR